MTPAAIFPAAPSAPAFEYLALDEYLRSRAQEWDRTAVFTRADAENFGRHGLFDLLVAPEHGGRDSGIPALGNVSQAVARVSASAQSFVTVQAMVTSAISAWGTEQQKTWLPDLARGRSLSAFAVSEPGGGASWATIDTSARERSGGGWLVSGAKTWITAAQIADLLLVVANTPEAQTTFLIPADRSGITITPVPPTLGFRSSMLGRIDLVDVEVDVDDVLGPVGFGQAIMAQSLDVGRFTVACASVGLQQECLQAAVELAGGRASGRRKLRDSSLVQARIGDIAINLAASTALCREAGTLKQSGSSESFDATWTAKIFSARAAAEAARVTLQLAGAEGLASDSTVARCHRDAQVLELIEGTTDVGTLVIASRRIRGGLRSA